MTDHDATAVAYTASTLAEAIVVRGLLESAGIVTSIDDEILIVVLDGMVSGNKGVRVVVPAIALEEARSLIEEARDAADGDEDEDEDETP